MAYQETVSYRKNMVRKLGFLRHKAIYQAFKALDIAS